MDPVSSGLPVEKEAGSSTTGVDADADRGGFIHLSDLPRPPAGKTDWPWTEEAYRLTARTPDGRPWPRISVVTPSFNQVEYLEETLRSVLLQGYPNLEYIVIDGGSTDGSVSIIERYSPRLTRWVSEPDRGQSHAINKGLRYATGEILAWLNSDDIYYPGALATVAQAMEASGCDLFLGAMDKVEAVGEQVRFLKRSSPHEGNPLHPRAIFRNGSRADFHFIQPPLFWRHWVWERTGGLDERYHYVMDLEWCTRAIAAGAVVEISDELLARFTVHGCAKTQALLDRAMWERSRMYLRLARKGEYRTLRCLLCALGPTRRALTIGAGRARADGKQGRAAALRMGAATAGVALRLSRRMPRLG